MSDTCFMPDLEGLFSRLSSLLDKAESLLYLLLVIVVILVVGLIVSSLLNRSRRD